MIGNLINAIGGYGSWQFAILVIFCWIIGGLLYTRWVYFMPLPIFGCLLVFSWSIKEVSSALEKGVPSIIVIFPLLWVIGSIWVIIHFFPKKKSARNKTSDSQDNCNGVDERTCAICPNESKCKIKAEPK